MSITDNSLSCIYVTKCTFCIVCDTNCKYYYFWLLKVRRIQRSMFRQKGLVSHLDFLLPWEFAINVISLGSVDFFKNNPWWLCCVENAYYKKLYLFQSLPMMFTPPILHQPFNAFTLTVKFAPRVASTYFWCSVLTQAATKVSGTGWSANRVLITNCFASSGNSLRQKVISNCDC